MIPSDVRNGVTAQLPTAQQRNVVIISPGENGFIRPDHVPPLGHASLLGGRLVDDRLWAECKMCSSATATVFSTIT